MERQINLLEVIYQRKLSDWMDEQIIISINGQEKCGMSSVGLNICNYTKGLNK